MNITKDELVEALVQMGLSHKFTFVDSGRQEILINDEGCFWCGMRDPFGEIPHTYLDALIREKELASWQAAKLVYYHG